MMRFIDTRILVLATVAVLNPLALAQPETKAVAESDWGLPTNGVQMHIALADPARDTCPPDLRCPQQSALPGEFPDLIVHLRNFGTDPVSFSHGFSQYSQIEVDGRWYGWRGGVSASAAIFAVEPDSAPVIVYARPRRSASPTRRASCPTICRTRRRDTKADTTELEVRCGCTLAFRHYRYGAGKPSPGNARVNARS